MARRGVHGEMKSDIAIQHMEKFMNRKDKTEANTPLTLKEQIDAYENRSFLEMWPKSKWLSTFEKKCKEAGIPVRSFYEFKSNNDKLFNEWYMEEKLPDDKLARILRSKY